MKLREEIEKIIDGTVGVALGGNFNELVDSIMQAIDNRQGKRLEWVKIPHDSKSIKAIVPTLVDVFYGVWTERKGEHVAYFGDDDIKHCGTLSEAQSACQQHFNNLIKGALE